MDNCDCILGMIPSLGPAPAFVLAAPTSTSLGYLLCGRGCGSKFKNLAPLQRHQEVCTFGTVSVETEDSKAPLKGLLLGSTPATPTSVPVTVTTYKVKSGFADTDANSVTEPTFLGPGLRVRKSSSLVEPLSATKPVREFKEIRKKPS